MANKINELRRNLVASSEAERSAMLKALKGYADEAAAIQAICMTPTMLLGRVALGDPKRTQYMQQLDGAGPVEMETAARQAIMTGDLVLASAIATVVDRRPKDRRPFTVQAFAERVIGPIWGRMNTKLEGVQLSFKSALAADREFVRGQADPLMNLSLALSQQPKARRNDHGTAQRNQGEGDPRPSPTSTECPGGRTQDRRAAAPGLRAPGSPSERKAAQGPLT